MTNRKSLVRVVLLIVLSGCSATSLTDSWQAPSLHRQAMNDVLVVGVLSNMNTTNRILFERGFVDALKAKGINATASYEVLGQGALTREAVTAFVKKNNIKYVLATRFGGAEVVKELVPESVYTYYTYAGYWSGYGTTMTRESYVDTKTTFVLTTSIFDAANGRSRVGGPQQNLRGEFDFVRSERTGAPGSQIDTLIQTTEKSSCRRPLFPPATSICSKNRCSRTSPPCALTAHRRAA